MKIYQKEYRQFLAEIGPEAFKRPLLTHRNASGRLGEEREPGSSQFLLFEPRVEGEEFAQPSKEIAGAKGMDAVL